MADGSRGARHVANRFIQIHCTNATHCHAYCESLKYARLENNENLSWTTCVFHVPFNVIQTMCIMCICQCYDGYCESHNDDDDDDDDDDDGGGGGDDNDDGDDGDDGDDYGDDDGKK